MKFRLCLQGVESTEDKAGDRPPEKDSKRSDRNRNKQKHQTATHKKKSRQVGDSEQDEHSGASGHPNKEVQGQQTAQCNLHLRDIGEGVSECSSRVPSDNKQE